jgi:hypothetical protein
MQPDTKNEEGKAKQKAERKAEHKVSGMAKSAIEGDAWQLLALNPRFLPSVRQSRQLSSEDTKGKAAVFHLHT